MAESTFVLELAESLAQEDIPIKLRCASCNKLVVNAFRLPCCDQSVCEPCQQILPSECPVCAHSPLSSDDCKPNKALRLTVRAFLKNEEKKRDKAKEASNAVPETHTGYDLDTTQETPAEANEELHVAAAPPDEAEGSTPTAESASKIQSGEDIKTSIESPEDTTEVKDDADTGPESEGATAGDNEVAEDQYKGNTHDGQQQASNNVGMGMSGAMNGQAWNAGDFTPMMAMQNNMINSAAFGGFPNMMGMPMGMDPMMMSQGMFGGLNGAGMGMGGMNMGMGFDGNMSGWGNQGSMGMMMNGDFGTNPGFFPGGGYNHQQSNHMHNQQFQNERYHQNRFNRGRGYFQRGGYNRDRGRPQNFHSAHGWNPKSGPDNGSGSNIQVNADSDQQTETDHQDTSLPPAGDENQDTSPSQQNGVVTAATGQISDTAGEGDRPSYVVNADSARAELNQGSENTKEPGDKSANPEVDQVERGMGPTNFESDITLRAPQGPAAHYMSNQGTLFVPRGRGGLRGNYRGAFRGRGGLYQDQLPAQLPGPGVAGAPTGPKAMREGFPNTGIRGRGGFHSGRGVPTGPSPGISRQITSEQAEQNYERPEEAQNPPSHDSVVRSRSRSLPRSPVTPERESYHSRSPHERFVQDDGQANNNDNDYSDHADPRSSRYAEGLTDDRRNEVVDERRGAVPEENPDGEFRSRRHRSRDEKHRPSRRGRDRSRSRSNSRGHKHRRHRSRSPQYEGRRDRERNDRDHEGHKRSRRERSAPIDAREKRRRDEANDRHHRRRHSSRSRRHEAGETPQTAAAPTQPREFKIAGRSKMRQEEPSDVAERPSDGPSAEDNVDPYLAERLQRDRERMAKEQESRGMVNDGRSDRKRSFADGAGAGARAGANADDRHGAQRRRLSYYGDDNIDLIGGQRAEGRRDGRRWR